VVIVGFLSGRSAAAFGRRRRGDVGLRPKVLGDEVGVLTKPVARAFDLDDDRMAEKAVEERGSDSGIAGDVTPFREAAVGGENHGALLISGVTSRK